MWLHVCKVAFSSVQLCAYYWQMFFWGGALCDSDVNKTFTWFLRSGEVREFKSTMVQKLTKMQKKNRTVARTLHTAVQKFFCSLRSQIIYTFTFSFVLPPLFLVLLQAIESQHWYFAWTNLSGKTINFVLESQGKVRENVFCRVVGTMVVVVVLLLLH